MNKKVNNKNRESILFSTISANLLLLIKKKKLWHTYEKTMLTENKINHVGSKIIFFSPD